MPWMAIIGAGASLLSGSSQADAASQAADAQAKSAADANATQRYMYDTTRADNAPFLNNGVAGNNKLAYLLGLNPLGNGMGGGASGGLTREALRNQLMPQFTRSGSSAGATGTQAAPQSRLEQMLAGLQTPPPNGVTRLTPYFDPIMGPDNWDRVSYTTQGSLGSTVDEAGLNAEIERRLAEQSAQQQAQQQQAQNDPAYGSLLRNFTMADRDADPVYQSGLQFGLDQGVQGINRMASANGGTDNGAILKALARFGNDYGSTKAADSFNRFDANRKNTFNMLSGISGTGQVASNQVGAAGQNYANQVSQNQIGVGNARAASAIGGANALSGGFTNAYNGYQQNRLMNQLFPQNGGYTPGFGDSTYGAGADYSGFDMNWG